MPQLQRQVGVFGAIVLGLGSIVGTGVFVSIGIAAGVTGPAVIAAIGVASLVAACNGLSSAQLAANHPVSGGTYEYGHRWLNPVLGFSAGWMFVCAKTASAATAALGFAAYVAGITTLVPPENRIVLALATVLVLTLLVLQGLRRSNTVNAILVLVTVTSLTVFVVAALPAAVRAGTKHLDPFLVPSSGGSPWGGFAEACALMFVAFTGYGRIATMGEEIVDPRRSIPRAMIITLVVSLGLYVSVAVVAVAAVGVEGLVEQDGVESAPLQRAGELLGGSGLAIVVSIGATVAMLGVLLNLILGLSRVVLAMGRRGDLPAACARLDRRQETPWVAVILVGVTIAGLVLVNDIRTTWTFSAFTVLLYYALTNLAAIRLSRDERLYPAWISWCGLVACGFLAFWVPWQIWLTGLGILATGLAWRFAWRKMKPPGDQDRQGL